MKKKSYCLIIDSGLGGLHILAKARKLCPAINFLYIADDKSLPYGNKSSKEITTSILSIYNRFKTCYNITSLVLACNTATAASINRLREILTIPIIGTEPNIKAPTKMHFKKIAILATPLTIKTKRFRNLTNEYTFSIPCNGLAAQIENLNLYKKKINLTHLINTLRIKQADCLVLGCTHYSFIASYLKVLNIPIFDSIDGVAKQIQLTLQSSAHKNGNTIILTTSHNTKLTNSYVKYYNKLLCK